MDSKLGQTSKNISALFNELHKIPQPQKIIILFDEIDALAIDRINSNCKRTHEMISCNTWFDYLGQKVS